MATRVSDVGISRESFEASLAHMAIARPNKSVGRVVLGPRLAGTALLRIVAGRDGSGQIQLYDEETASWCDATELWTFSDVWSAPPAVGARYLSLT
jgi:hypothetical protein